MWPDQRHIGDLDASDQEREEAQPRYHVLGSEPRPAVAALAQADVVEAHRAGREQRYRGAAAQHRIEPGDGADLGLHGRAHGLGRHQKREDHESAEARDRQGRNGKSKAPDANDRGHASFSSFPALEPAITEGERVRKLQSLCDAFVAGPSCGSAAVSGG
jgi:hypothetical protein